MADRKSHRSRSRHNSDNESEASRVSESEDRNRSNSRRRRHRSSRDSSGSESDHQSSHRRSNRRNRCVLILSFFPSIPPMKLKFRNFIFVSQTPQQPRIDIRTCGFRSPVARDSRTPGCAAKPDGHRPSGRFQHSRSTATRPTGDGPQGDDERGERFVVERQRFAAGSIAKRFDHSRDEFAGVLLAPSPPPQTQSQASSQAQVRRRSIGQPEMFNLNTILRFFLRFD